MKHKFGLIESPKQLRGKIERNQNTKKRRRVDVYNGEIITRIEKVLVDNTEKLRISTCVLLTTTLLLFSFLEKDEQKNRLMIFFFQLFGSNLAESDD